MEKFITYITHPVELISGFLAVAFLALPRGYLQGWIALFFGDDTPKQTKRMSWNPFVHLDPVGTVAFILFDFGWTRPIPIRPWKMKSRRWGLLAVSVAGPIINLVEALIFAEIAKSVKADSFTFDVMYKSAKYSLTYSFFSLFPIPPLDGSKILGALLPEDYMEWYVKYQIYGILFMLGILVLWILPIMMNPFVKFFDMLINSIIGL